VAAASEGASLPGTLLWFIRVIGSVRRALADRRKVASTDARLNRFRKLVWDFDGQVEEFAATVGDVERSDDEGRIFLISRNRAAAPAMDRSIVTVKADAARRLFQLGCDKLTWAILDSGIDAKHPAFRKRDAAGNLVVPAPGREAEASRVVATYDFTRIRSLLNPFDAERQEALDRLDKKFEKQEVEDLSSAQREREALVQSLQGEEAETAKQLRTMLLNGRVLDWSLFQDLVKVPHDDKYHAPAHDHGTHVAGILASDWQGKDHRDDPDGPPDEDLVGMCPDIRLIDLRVFDANGTGDEFAVMAALQFIRWLNGSSDQPMIFGANLSLSIRHDVTNFACGRTPVCDECARLVNSGVVVVAAAGNAGRAEFTLASGESSEGYRSISISDPGNTDEVITVGATHRYQPHTYGVSYFSSRGPTGDGRSKPDLVAPGERIASTLPDGGAGTKDGTSMAAPHVSGAAALLLARHRELVGRPLQLKDILCSSATDLRRERYFQGAGLVDVLRAIQKV
jgi:subtilisin family serine protease